MQRSTPIPSTFNIYMTAETADPQLYMQSTGTTIVRSIKNGIAQETEYTDLQSAITIPADINTAISITGDAIITELNFQNVTSIAITGDTSALTTLYLYLCPNLTTFGIQDTQSLNYIMCWATYEDVANGVAAAITNSTGTGTVETNNDTYTSIITTAANNKGWTVITW